VWTEEPCRPPSTHHHPPTEDFPSSRSPFVNPGLAMTPHSALVPCNPARSLWMVDTGPSDSGYAKKDKTSIGSCSRSQRTIHPNCRLKAAMTWSTFDARCQELVSFLRRTFIACRDEQCKQRCRKQKIEQNEGKAQTRYPTLQPTLSSQTEPRAYSDEAHIHKLYPSCCP
jgi:hypothetical protein